MTWNCDLKELNITSIESFMLDEFDHLHRITNGLILAEFLVKGIPLSTTTAYVVRLTYVNIGTYSAKINYTFSKIN